MSFYNARNDAQARMIRRIFCIGLMFLIKWTALAGRLVGYNPVMGSEPPPTPTLGGKQFWADELFFHQWRIQRSSINGQYRLLDERDWCHATGTFDECRTVLNHIKRQRRLPPMKGKAVVVLHGLVRSRSSMDSLCQYLCEEGKYEVFNVEYPSTQCDMAEHARALRKIIDHLDGIEEINFIGHSMGNIIVRHYLGDLERQDPLKQSADEAAADHRAKARLHRFVMLAPPNRGSQLAEAFADNPIFKGIAGDAGQELGRRWPELEKRLATPPFSFGIIAGGKGNDKGYNPLLKGDNDGTISVETAKLPGARDFIVVPRLHSFIMDSDKVQRHVLHFLQHDCFVSESKRHPLEKQEKQP